MSSTIVVPTATAEPSHASRAALRRAQVALYTGAAAAVGLVAITSFTTTSTDVGKFHHLGDYLLTADGIPYMLALLVLLPALRSLQYRDDGRIGRAGVAIAGFGAIVLVGMFVWGLIAANGGSLGPVYVLAVLVTVIGVALSAAGSWRSRLFPRWLVVLWPIAWLLGIGPIGPKPAPLALTAVYLTMAALLRNRTTSFNGR